MKITRTSNRARFLEDKKKIANIGCNRCPCCGESKSYIDYFEKGVWGKGIISGGVKSWCEGGLFKKSRHMKVNAYVCKTCGAHWESEPYECV